MSALRWLASAVGTLIVGLFYLAIAVGILAVLIMLI